jgi:hypothetical protein
VLKRENSRMRVFPHAFQSTHTQSHTITHNHTQSHTITHDHTRSHTITHGHIQSHTITYTHTPTNNQLMNHMCGYRPGSRHCGVCQGVSQHQTRCKALAAPGGGWDAGVAGEDNVGSDPDVNWGPRCLGTTAENPQ